MRFRRGRIGDGLAVLAGARPDVLAAAPGARAKFVALGGVLLSTGGLALVSMAFAVHMALGVWWPLALLVGLGWGFVVVNLDRMLLVGMAHDSSMKRNLVLAVPRVGLALVLGVVIATPLTLQVFAKEIDTEIVTMQAEAADAYQASLAADSRFARLPELEERIATAEAIVASGGVRTPASRSCGARWRLARPSSTRRSPRRASSRRRRSASSTGRAGPATPGAARPTSRRGRRPTRRRRSCSAARSELDDAVDAASSAESRSASLAAASLDDRPGRADAADRRAGAAAGRVRRENEDAGGLLMRLEALDRLGDRNGTLAAAQFMLSLLFMSVELLPVLMKLLLNFSPPTAYDRLAALRDSGDVEIEEMAQESRKSVAQAKEELLVMAEKERVDRQKEAILTRRRAALADLADAAGQRRRPWPPRRADEVAPAVRHRADPGAGAQRRHPDGAHRPSASGGRVPTPV